MTNSPYRQIAKKIPDNLRSVLLLSAVDPIGNADTSRENEHMQLLFTVWREFIEPGSLDDIDCGICRSRILRNFRELKSVLEEMEEEHQLYIQLRNRTS